MLSAELAGQIRNFGAQVELRGHGSPIRNLRVFCVRSYGASVSCSRGTDWNRHRLSGRNLAFIVLGRQSLGRMVPRTTLKRLKSIFISRRARTLLAGCRSAKGALEGFGGVPLGDTPHSIGNPGFNAVERRLPESGK